VSFSAQELRQLLLPLIACLLLLGAGAALVVWTQERETAEARALAAVRAERAQASQRLMRIAEEEREVKEKLEKYQQLQALGILGAERRLEWADAMTRIRTELELPDLRYRVERQRLLTSVAGKPSAVDFYASKMSADLALLHEGDLFSFLESLRASGNAYYSVRRCALTRTGPIAAAARLTPRLRAECEIDLITIIDRAAKT
jgi:hypothetical protein